MKSILQSSVTLVPWSVRNMIRKIPLVAACQRFLLAKFLEGREFVHEIDAGPARGLKFPIILPDDKGVWTGTYELSFFQSLADGLKKGDVCFDIGGWRGYCGGVMSVQGASKAVVFEPLPQNAPRIRKLIELNPDLPLEFVPAAAGEHDGQTTFVIMDATSMGKLSNSTFQSDTRSDNEITVDVVSLDSWCETNAVAHPDLMKIDVEGAEIMVLRGAMGILKSRKPRLFIEAHSRELTTEVVDLLRPLGYKVTALETAQAPDGKSEPPVCHLVGVANEH